MFGSLLTIAVLTDEQYSTVRLFVNHLSPNEPPQLASLYRIKRARSETNAVAKASMAVWEAQPEAGRGNSALFVVADVLRKIFTIPGMMAAYGSVDKMKPQFLRISIDGTNSGLDNVIVFSFCFCDAQQRILPKYKEFVVGLAVGKSQCYNYYDVQSNVTPAKETYANVTEIYSEWIQEFEHLEKVS